MLLSENKSLKELCTLGIGGNARFYVEVKTDAELQEALMHCYRHSIPTFILGKGSNCVFDDRGFAGCVIHNKIHYLEKQEGGLFKAGAGYSFALLGVQTAREGYSGLEFASGIPASVGGALFMNAGANGLETKDFLHSVEYVTAAGDPVTFLKEDLIFGYRYSSFQDFDGAIASATFALIEAPQAREKQLKIIRYRQETQPYGEKSAGCVFRNPQDDFAGKLIEECGLKGKSCGGAQVSTLHANFLINTGNATSKDFLELIQLIHDEVKRQKGIDLESEVRIIPYEGV